MLSVICLFRFLAISFVWRTQGTTTASPVLNNITSSESANNLTTDWLSFDVIGYIRSYKFRQADEIILQMEEQSANTNIAKIVQLLHANSEENFNLLIDYIKGSQIISIRYAVLTALWNEMEPKLAKVDVNKLIILYNVLSKEVIDDEETSNVIKTEATAKRDSGLRPAIIDKVAKILKTALIYKDYHKNTSIQDLISDLQSLNEQISDDTIRKVVDDIYTTVPKEDLIREMYNNQTIPQSVTALVRIYNKFRSYQTRHLFGPATMLTAYYLRRLQEMPDYEHHLSEQKKNDVTSVIRNLPASTRNLYFAEKVCLRNVLHAEYLYSPLHRSTKNMRNVFTWGDKTADNQSYWIVKIYDEFSFQFVSDYNQNEFLYVPDMELFNERYHRVMTYVPGGSVEEQSVWKVEAYKNEVYIHNPHFTAFLCVSDTGEMHSQNRRFVFAKKRQYNVFGKDCQWTVETL